MTAKGWGGRRENPGGDSACEKAERRELGRKEKYEGNNNEDEGRELREKRGKSHLAKKTSLPTQSLFILFVCF